MCPKNGNDRLRKDNCLADQHFMHHLTGEGEKSFGIQNSRGVTVEFSCLHVILKNPMTAID